MTKGKPVTLIKEMAARGVEIEDIAKLLGIHRNSAANKIYGRTAFSIAEGFRIHDEFFPDIPMKILFKKEDS